MFPLDNSGPPFWMRSPLGGHQWLFSRGRGFVAVGSLGAVVRFDVEARQVSKVRELGSNIQVCVPIGPSRLLIGWVTGRVGLFDLDTLALTGETDIGCPGIVAAAVSEPSHLVAVRSAGGKSVTLEFGAGDELSVGWSGQLDDARVFVFNRTGSALLIGGASGNCRQRSLAAANTDPPAFASSPAPISHVLQVPNSKSLLVADTDGSLIRLEEPDGRPGTGAAAFGEYPWVVGEGATPGEFLRVMRSGRVEISSSAPRELASLRIATPWSRMPSLAAGADTVAIGWTDRETSTVLLAKSGSAEISKLQFPEAEICRVSLGGNPPSLCVAFAGGGMRLFAEVSGEWTQTAQYPANAPLVDACLSPHGHRLASLSARGECRLTFVHGNAADSVSDYANAYVSGHRCLSWSRNSRLFGIASGPKVDIREADSGDTVADFSLAGADVSKMAWSRDERLLVLGRSDGGLTLLELPKRRVWNLVGAHDGPIRSIAGSRCDDSFRIGGADGAVTAWKLDVRSALGSDAPAPPIRGISNEEADRLRGEDAACASETMWFLAASGDEILPDLERLWNASPPEGRLPEADLAAVNGDDPMRRVEARRTLGAQTDVSEGRWDTAIADAPSPEAKEALRQLRDAARRQVRTGPRERLRLRIVRILTLQGSDRGVATLAAFAQRPATPRESLELRWALEASR
ncbi:MAG: hypothetical protein HYY18_13280 [Planctomycetes bacterium]|nr:hypothetical protein [Planctomycetota bacterium]